MYRSRSWDESDSDFNECHRFEACEPTAVNTKKKINNLEDQKKLSFICFLNFATIHVGDNVAKSTVFLIG